LSAVPRNYVTFQYLEIGMDDDRFLRYSREKEPELARSGADGGPPGFPPD
jgi:hypothetical protein